MGGPLQVGVFLLFLAIFTWPWTPIHWAIILAQYFFGNSAFRVFRALE